jgi:integrase
MAVYKQAKSKYWWYKFTWNGEAIRESTKQTNKRVAETMEAAHRTALAKGEVGIRDKKPVPTLKEFAEDKFLPFVRATKAEKPRTIAFYETTVKNLKSRGALATLRLDRITSEDLGEFVAGRQGAGMKVSTINRELATVRRIFNLAQEWGDVATRLPRVKMNPGENQRMRVLNGGQERAYLNAATNAGRGIEQAYEQALQGIRAVVRGEQPTKPDAYLLRDVATILFDCGLRPEECYRLRWESFIDGGINIHYGKGKGSRRRVPCADRVRGILEMRSSQATSEWVFPAHTKSGHIESSTIKKQHAAALKAADVSPFVIYDLRHTCITRWAKTLPLPVVQKLAGHTNISTTMRYVHLNDEDVLVAMKKVEEEKSGHTSGHTDQKPTRHEVNQSTVIN